MTMYSLMYSIMQLLFLFMSPDFWVNFFMTVIGIAVIVLIFSWRNKRDVSPEVVDHFTRRILWQICVYALLATTVRMSSSSDSYIFLGAIDHVAARAVRIDLVLRAMYYSLPFIALCWVIASKSGRRCLIFLQGWALVGIWNHLLSVMIWVITHPNPFAERPPGHYGNEWRFAAPLTSSIPAFFLGGIMVFLFINAYRLFRRKFCANLERPMSGYNKKDTAVALLCLLLFCFSPYLQTQREMNARKAVEKEAHKQAQIQLLGEILYNESNVINIQGSPDGKYLAVGGREGLYLWDVDKRVCVWQDLTISPDILKFSRNGKYLAAAKSVKWMRSRRAGVHEKLQEELRDTVKDLAVYEMATRKELSLRRTPPKLENPQIILDIAFDADEKNLHIASGWGHYVSDVSESCLKNINTSAIRLSNGVQKPLRALANLEDWIPSQSVLYAEDASQFFHVWLKGGKWLGSEPKKRYLVVHNMENGEHRAIEQHEKYDISTATEWKARNGQLYFLTREREQYGRTIGDFFATANFKDGITWDLHERRWDKDVHPAGVSERFSRIVFSPDGTRAALLGRRAWHMFGWKCDLYICIVRLSDGKVLQEIRRNYPVEIEGTAPPWSLAWVRDDLLIMSTNNTPMSWIPIEKGLK